MKRLIILLLTLVTAVGFSTAASPKRQKSTPEAPRRYLWNDGHASNYEQPNLYGDVESMTIHYVRSYGDEVKVDETTKITFNKRGDIVEAVDVDPKGDTIFLTTCEYDKDGFITNHSLWDYGTLRVRYEYSYNDDRTIQYERWYNDEGECTGSFENVFDPKNRKEDIEGALDPDLVVGNDDGYIYTELGYDYSNQWSDGAVYISVYNDFGLLERNYFVRDNEVEQTSYVYDKRGLEIERTIWSSNIEYNVYDNIIEMESPQLDGVSIQLMGVAQHYILERDKRGNVVKIIATPDHSGYNSVTTYDIKYRK